MGRVRVYLQCLTYCVSHTQLHEERRQHENTSMKLADMLNALADRDFMQLEHENMQALELSEKCRQLDLRWQVQCVLLTLALSFPVSFATPLYSL